MKPGKTWNSTALLLGGLPVSRRPIADPRPGGKGREWGRSKGESRLYAGLLL